MSYVRLLSKLLRDKEIGKYIVTIVPDEARTFGMDSLFRQSGIYSHVGQLYEPVDRDSLMYYKEIKTGNILEEGITEAGSISSFIAAGTSYTTHGINMIPFFTFYSMFGFQRIGDLIWAAGDAQAKGFLVGGTSGRTTLAGEGLQHQDGQSHIYAYPLPNLLAYDPTFSYEIAVIIREGIYRMFEKQENLIYYITVMNEFYIMPKMPEGVEEGILKGLYKYKASDLKDKKAKVHLMGSGAILRESIKAQQILEEKYKIPTDVWSVTSYKNLYFDAISTERNNILHPEEKPKKSYIEECFKNHDGVFVAASDYLKALPGSIANWIPGRFIMLGTDGFGRSDNRIALRDHFEVDAKHIVLSSLNGLAEEGLIEKGVVIQALKDLGINKDKPNPVK